MVAFTSNFLTAASAALILSYISPAAALPANLHKRAGPVPVLSKCVTPGQFALTFDDGPSVFTKQVLDVLRQKGAKATFFVNGNNIGRIEDFQQEIRTMDTDGHMIASHTFTHATLTSITDDNAFINNEIKPLEEAIFSIVGKRPAYFRPPFGAITPRQLELLGEQGYKASVMWSIDTNDFRHPTVSPENVEASLAEYRRALSGPRDGHISLQHDIQPVTADVAGGSDFVARAVDLVKGAGYELVLVDECLGDKGGAYVKGTLPPSGNLGNCKDVYTVVSGDFCFAIAEKKGISLDQLRALNPNLVCETLQVGQQLCLEAGAPGSNPGPAPPTPSSTIAPPAPPAPTSTTAPGTCPRGQPYTVVPGDFCFKIAEQFGMTLDALRALNPIIDAATNPNCNIFPGQNLCVEGNAVAPQPSPQPQPQPQPQPGPQPGCARTHTVASGEFCFLIASNNGLTLDQLISLNPGVNCDLIVPNQVLCVAGGAAGAPTQTLSALPTATLTVTAPATATATATATTTATAAPVLPPVGKIGYSYLV